MNFNSIIDANSSTPTTSTSSPFTQMLGQQDFLKLLTTQMQMQDPTDPVDNKQMLAQMAQFSSLAGLSDINDTLKLISAKLDSVLQNQGQATTTGASTDTTTPATTPTA
jgi:flagellar basal-body rod modification protein FlgD